MPFVIRCVLIIHSLSIIIIYLHNLVEKEGERVGREGKEEKENRRDEIEEEERRRRDEKEKDEMRKRKRGRGRGKER